MKRRTGNEFVTQNVADVDDTQTIDLLPGDLRLTLVERAVTEADRHEQMRGLVRSVLADARLNYDYILIDCPPGLSLLTEIWLREADYHLAPVKPDFLAIAGLEMFREFKKINPELKMAENLGILVNMKNSHSAEDDNYHNILANDVESNCFPQAIPHMTPIQHAARFSLESRSFVAKYPGSAGHAFRNTVEELLRRTGDVEQTEVPENLSAEVLEEQVFAEVEAAPVEEFAVPEQVVVEQAVVEQEVPSIELAGLEEPPLAPEVIEEPQAEEMNVAATPVRPAGAPGQGAMKGAAGIASKICSRARRKFRSFCDARRNNGPVAG